ncbi:MAG: hypothetical protein ACP5QI_00335 [Candidatus Bathyarchaeia archaeon]
MLRRSFYFPCRREGCGEARHVWNWLSLFQLWHNIAHQGLDKPPAMASSPEALRFITLMQEAILT